MNIETKENRNRQLKALIVSPKTAQFVTVERMDDPLPTRCYKFKVYTMGNQFIGTHTWEHEFVTAENQLTENKAKPLWNGHVTFRQDRSGQNHIYLEEAHLADGLDLFGHTAENTLQILQDFFASDPYRNFVESHDKHALLKDKIIKEEGLVSLHQRHINRLKRQYDL